MTALSRQGRTPMSELVEQAPNQRWRDWLKAIRRPVQEAGESDEAWTQRVIDNRLPGTNRQCSIGWHSECSDPNGDECTCPCHWYSLEDYIKAIIELEDLLTEQQASDV